MYEKQATDSSFPGIAFAVLPATGETIAIRSNERIYYRVKSSKTADELNVMYGVTDTQARAALERLLAGWGTPPVEPETNAA